MRLTHKKKKTLARRMMTPKEIREHKSIFDSKAWNEKKEAIIKRIEKQKQKNLERKLKK